MLPRYKGFWDSVLALPGADIGSHHINIFNGQSFTMDSAVDKVHDHGQLLFVVCEVVEENARGVDEQGDGGEVGGVAGGGVGHDNLPLL